IAVNEDRLAIAHGPLDSLTRLADAMNRSRVVEIANTRRRISPELLVGRNPPPRDDRAQLVVRDGKERKIPRRIREVPGVVEHWRKVYASEVGLRIVERGCENFERIIRLHRRFR